MPIKSALKRYSGSEWVDVYLKTQSDVVYRTSGQTVESDLTNFLPGVTGTNSAPAETSLGKLFTANDGSVYSSDVDGTPVQLASKQYVDDNKYTLPNASSSAIGGVKQGAAVADATGSEDAHTKLNALLASLRTAGVIANS